MTRVAGEWLTRPATQTMFSLLQNGGFQAFAVGGCVRNDLLGFPVADVDFTTDATTQQVSALSKKADLRAVPTGIDHGTVTVVVAGAGHEVTTFRKDVQTDGRRATVIYARSVIEDAQRRDFTINALYSDRAGQVFDPLGGLPDIAARRVRFIGDPAARIQEDYLRILRFFRFQAWFANPNEGIDAEALAACSVFADGIKRLSHERIGAEMTRLLGAPDPAPALAAMERAGVLMRILPGASAANMAVLVDLEQRSGVTPNWTRRLSNLGGSDLVQRLRLGRKDMRRIRLLQNSLTTDAEIPELAYRHGADIALDTALLRHAANGTPLPSDLGTKINHAAAQSFPLQACDITTGEQGAALGARLKRLEIRWIKSGFALSKAELLE